MADPKDQHHGRFTAIRILGGFQSGKRRSRFLFSNRKEKEHMYPTILFCAHVDHRSLMEELVDYGQAHEMFEGYTPASGFGPMAISGLIRTEHPVCIVFDASLDLQFVKDTAAAIRAKAEMPRTVLIVLLAHGQVAIDPTLFDASFVQTEMDANYLLKLVLELIEQQKA